MAKQKTQRLEPSDYIVPININGMNGRMLKLPAPKNKKREILLVYGLHASIERMGGFTEDLNQYGSVTLPDLPGFGGMDTFYKIGEKPTIDNYADYLATVIKLRYGRKRLTIIAMSYGFVLVTRMLQKYPNMVNKVDLLVSLVGFVHHEDFDMNNNKRNFIKFVAWSGRHYLPSRFLKHIAFRDLPIRATYKIVAKNHRKLHDADKEELNRRIDFEVKLWKMNDARTKGYVASDMFKVNLCGIRVEHDVHHVSIKEDHFFDNNVVEQHMNVIYTKVNVIPADMEGHAPTVIADAEAAAPFIPKKLRRLLARKPNKL